MKKQSIFKILLYVLQGMFVGVGAILPGISGGVLCVAFGIYEPMMELLTHPFKALKKNYKMFIPLILGAMVGFILLANAVELLLTRFEGIALMLFFGLISGTLPELFKTSELSDRKKSWTPFIAALAIAYFFFHILENGVSTVIAPSVIAYLFCGLVWGLSLILPGLSSSSILIYLGLYEPMTKGIAAFDLMVLIPLFLGIGASALLLARLVNMLLKKQYAVMSRIVLGIVIASSLKIVPASFHDAWSLVIAVICFVIGFVIARGMDVIKAKQAERACETESESVSESVCE
jgi:putative membrane protein